MTSLIKIWIPNDNYWDLHPMFKNFGKFKEIYNKDKSKKKIESSKLMWAIAMLVDPHDENLIRNQPLTEKKLLISTDFLEDKQFNWDHPEIIELITEYTNFALSIAEKELIRYELKLTQRGDFLQDVDYTMDTYGEDPITGKTKIIKGTADQLDKMLLNSGKIFEEINSIREKISKENLESQLKGGATESAGENKHI